MKKKFGKIGKKWWIIGAGVLTLGVVLGIFFYEKNSPKVFTKSEYVKEVIVQNENFKSVLDNFLDQVTSYNGSKDATEKLENTAAKFPEFVKSMESQLGPRVPSESKNHYNKMMAAYKIYLEAIDLYKKCVPKNLGEERLTLMKQAQSKLEEAENSMKNLE